MNNDEIYRLKHEKYIFCLDESGHLIGRKLQKCITRIKIMEFLHKTDKLIKFLIYFTL